jgi:hypothetical protein
MAPAFQYASSSSSFSSLCNPSIGPYCRTALTFVHLFPSLRFTLQELQKEEPLSCHGHEHAVRGTSPPLFFCLSR